MRKGFIKALAITLLLVVSFNSGASPAKVTSAPIHIEERVVETMSMVPPDVIQYMSVHQDEPIPLPVVAYENQDYIELEAPINSSFKSYMSYKAITSKSSDQYKYQKKAETNELGIRCIEGRYMIALGTFYCTKIGTKIDVILETGVVLECILGDVKDDAHTDSSRQQQLYDKSVVEFIVDIDKLEEVSRLMGDMSYSSNFEGDVMFIRVYE